MRSPVNAETVRAVAAELGRLVPGPARIYLVGGATAVIEGWRASTVDLDLRAEPDGVFFGHITAVKERLSVNIAGGGVLPGRLAELFGAIRPELERFPAVDPVHLAEAVNRLAGTRPAPGPGGDGHPEAGASPP